MYYTMYSLSKFHCTYVRIYIRTYVQRREENKKMMPPKVTGQLNRYIHMYVHTQGSAPVIFQGGNQVIQFTANMSFEDLLLSVPSNANTFQIGFQVT